ERHQTLIQAGLAEKSLRIFINQLKNTRAPLLNVALERSHWRRLVRTRALGKTQQKTVILRRNLLGNTLTRRVTSEILNGTAMRNSRSKYRRDLPGRIGGPGLRCQAISLC